MVFFLLHFSFAVYGLDPHKKRDFHGVESFLRILNQVLFLEFFDSLILTGINLAWAIPLYAYFKNWDMQGFMYPYIFFHICFVLCSYFIVYLRKRSFFFYQENEKKMNWFKSILENLKSGFVYVRNSKISMINKTMTEMLKQIQNIDKLFIKTKEKFVINSISNEFLEKIILESEENSRNILNFLLNDVDDSDNRLCNNSENFLSNNSSENECKIENLSNRNSDKIINLNSDINFTTNLIPTSDSFLEKFKRKNISNNKEFILVGTKSLEVLNNSENDNITLEVFCRYQLNQETLEDEFEIIFNDITKARQIEKKKSELKYKSIFLSKVAHEFKNPLICINELAQQLNEGFKSLNNYGVNQQIQENLNQIFSFSNYLMILIRDFDYFSQSNVLNKKINLENEECDVKEILNFCNDIATNLISRSSKENLVSFHLDINDDVPNKIMTDECRLKQVLINLISNSIKFTNRGKVNLIARKKESSLEFRVSDTGIGIDEKNKKNLFAPYNSSKLSKFNPHGTGLGMSIIKDLTKSLGNRINFTSELNKGSDFFFSIPINCTNNLPKLEIQNGADSKEISTKSSEINEVNNLDERKVHDYSKVTLLQTEADCKENPSGNCNQMSVENLKLTSSSEFVCCEEIDQNDHHRMETLKKDNLRCQVPKLIQDVISKNLPFKNHLLPIVNDHSINELSNKINENVNLNKIGNLSQEEYCKNIHNHVNTPEIKIKITDKSSNARHNIKHIEDLTNHKDKYLEKDAFQFSYVRSQSSSKLKPISYYSTQFLDSLNFDEDCVNIILIDDEKLARLSNKRFISDYAHNNNLNINIIEAEDGIECLYILYIFFKNGIKISCVISDQNMLHMNGSTTATVIKKFTNSNIFSQLQFYILTAYEDENTINTLKTAPITNVFSKPIKRELLYQILREIK